MRCRTTLKSLTTKKRSGFCFVNNLISAVKALELVSYVVRIPWFYGTSDSRGVFVFRSGNYLFCVEFYKIMFRTLFGGVVTDSF